MKPPASSSKNIVIVIIVLVLGALAYFYFQGGGTPAGVSSLLQGTPSTGASVGSAELTLLNQMRSLKVDAGFFASAAFSALQDFSQTIPTENVGRPRPFEPFPGAPSASTEAR